MTIVETHHLDDIGVATLKAHARVELCWASKAHAQECRHKIDGASSASLFSRIIRAIADSMHRPDIETQVLSKHLRVS